MELRRKAGYEQDIPRGLTETTQWADFEALYFQK